jgi:hypothetical protein
VSILIAGVGGLGRYCGVAPRSNLSMMIMRPPQQGQRFVVCGSAALRLIALMASTGIKSKMEVPPPLEHAMIDRRNRA